MPADINGLAREAKGRGHNGRDELWRDRASRPRTAYQATALDGLRRGVIPGTNTKLETLTESERRRHEEILVRLAQEAALANGKLLRELPSEKEEGAAA